MFLSLTPELWVIAVNYIHYFTNLVTDRMKSFVLLSMLIGGLLNPVVWAQTDGVYAQAAKLTPNLINGEKAYQLCAACHLQNGWGKTNGSFPVIASQHRSVVIKQLHDIQNKYRDNPTMYPFSDAKTIGGVQAIADVAAYIESLPMHPANGKGDGQHLDLGRQLYVTHCATCHGVSGQGSAEDKYPKISNQHFAYLIRQLQWMRDGYRTNADPIMLKLIKNMSQQQLEAVADYASRL